MKITNTEIFKYKDFEIVCQSFETQHSWGHTARLFDENNQNIASAKINYYNRTWERYQYQSVILQCVKHAIANRLDWAKYELGIKRLTQTKKDEIMKSDKKILALEECYTYFNKEYD